MKPYAKFLWSWARCTALVVVIAGKPAFGQTATWQAPATPPNDIPQAQSYSVIGQSAPSSDAAPPQTQFIINNDTGAVVGTVTDAP